MDCSIEYRGERCQREDPTEELKRSRRISYCADDDTCGTCGMYGDHLGTNTVDGFLCEYAQMPYMKI